MNIHQNAALTPLRRAQLVTPYRGQVAGPLSSGRCWRPPRSFLASQAPPSSHPALAPGGGPHVAPPKAHRLRDLFPPVPVIRYERPHPGDLLHIDIKKLPAFIVPASSVTGNPRDSVRNAGYDFVFVAIDHHSRLGHAAVFLNEQALTAVEFLRQAGAITSVSAWNSKTS